MRQAEDHRRAGRIKLALARYEEALKLAPQATAARVGRARMLVGLHRTAEALDELDAAIADDPRNAWARIAHAEVLVSLERHAGALIDTEAALEEEPDSIEALTVHGRLLTALGRHEESLEAFDQALKLDRDHVDAHVGRAEALAAMGADARARAAADRALERDPRSTDALLVKAQLQYGADRLAAGDKEIEAVLDIDPRDVRARLTRGREHLRRGDDRRALADFDAALVVEPELPGALYGRAAVLRERDPAGALHALERAFAAQRVAGAWQPGAAEVRELQAGLLLDAGRVEEALVAIEHGLAEAPGSAALLAARAQAQLALGRPQLALLDIDEAGAAGADVASLRTEAVAALAAQPPETWPEGITDSDVAHARYGDTLFAATLPDVRFDPYELARRAGHEDELLCLTGCRHRQEMLRRVVLLLTSRRLIWAGRVEGEVEWRDVRDVRPLPPNGMRLVLHEGRRLEFPGISDAGVDLSGADRRLDASGVLELAASLAR
jgi:tetratricopeptide (TPR) repeat protein